MSRAVALAALALLAGCELGIGQRCSNDQPCPAGLVCTRPAGGTAELGLCDYPPRTEGEPCLRAADCEAALTCSNHFDPGERYGTCTPRRAAGEACFVDRDCQSGACIGASGEALDGICG